MQNKSGEVRSVEVGALGERLAELRVRDASALEAVRRSVAQHGQLSPVVLFCWGGQLEMIDGFKRLHAARALGLSTLWARIDDVTALQAKLRLGVLSERAGLTELEEGWLVRSLYREEGLGLAQISHQMHRHKSWVWRRLMLVEALETSVQAQVRLGLVAARAAVAVSRLPRGNQAAASAVVVRRGLTVRQTELLVEQVLGQSDATSRATFLARLVDSELLRPPGPRSTRAVRNEADWISADVLKVRELCARLTARLSSTPLGTFAPPAAQLIRDALSDLPGVLHALDGSIANALARRDDVA